MSDFAGRAAIVTGASRGIGLAIAAALAVGGASVCLTARRRDALDAAAEELRSAGADVLAVAGDSADPTHRATAVQATLEAFGSVDMLVSNTGVNRAHGPLVGVDLDGVRRTLDTNVVAALGWTQECHRAWMGEHGGCVVNVSSVAGLRPAPHLGAYGASKAALVHLTRQLAIELAPSVRVNAVAPAIVRTRFAGPLFAHDEAAVAARYPLRRLGVPEDVAGAVVFLLSDAAAWMTGETLVVDGGLMGTGGVDGGV